MIVKNGGICFGYASISRSGIPQDTVKWSDGTLLGSEVSQMNMYLNEAHENDAQRGVKMRLGVGTTPPTLDDYWLDETQVNGVDVNQEIICTTASIGRGVNGSTLYTFTFYNNSRNTYTLKEICLAMVPSGVTGDDSPNGRHIMLARKLIVPRTVQPAETITFTYEISPCGGD